MVIVVLSPPGSTRPSSPSRSSRVRTNRVRAPDASSARTCSANAPCIARTPIKGPRRELLPASGSEQLFLRDGGNFEAAHRLSQAGRNLGKHVGLVEVRRRGHDRL